ncbi:hypothetical protein K437DRAFT_247796 [Tilletiaria anomala UBC 951]|uniref:Uncharacterized protein n=1 Tax=Tilletiaria anomala (strain ATCC 24038 / CBS 436.72 / UBC 951) TaxID=1037660 RepID=A0A066VW60_TILAU|nr:uncharacterized protein K437DRAFT_247796 [Tilletiaria anomala UBC 951]KDN44523.1 hypothetical protein K437DRAFT_247796 [Tilletiaria anomala UBC 951]
MSLQEGRPSADEYAEAGETSPFLHASTSASGTIRGPSPALISALIRRCRALIVRLLPVEIQEKSITSREGIVTRKVLEAFTLVAGDYSEAAPYALLEASRMFSKDSEKDDKSLNEQRALLCEVLARRLVARTEAAWVARAASSFRDEQVAHGPWAMDASHLGLTKKYSRLSSKNESSLPRSTLELAVDRGSIIFLSSPEVQRCVKSLWAGHLIKNYRADGIITFEPYHEVEKPGFWTHFDPSRLAVPRYSYYLSICLWIVFLVLYTISTRTVKTLDVWEILLWIFAAGYLVDDLTRWVKIRGLDNLDFWLIVDVATDTLFIASFVTRMVGFTHPPESQSRDHWQLHAFQLLACLAPLVWLQVMKLLDPLQYFGVIQVVILAMLKQTATFFILLLLVCVGFGQALWALDTADGRQVDNVLAKLADSLTQSILGDPDYDLVSENFGYPVGRILYYLLTFLTSLILSNILIAFFGDAYSRIVGEADNYYEAYFAQKVVTLTRAPDQFVYAAPFNLIEALIIVPLEPFVSRKTYALINHRLQSWMFFLPLAAIALYESRFDAQEAKKRRQRSINGFSDDHDQAAEEGQQGTLEDPILEEEERESQLKLSKVPFRELIAKLPSSHDYIEGKKQEEWLQTDHNVHKLLNEIKALRQQLADALKAGQTAL